MTNQHSSDNTTNAYELLKEVYPTANDDKVKAMAEILSRREGDPFKAVKFVDEILRTDADTSRETTEGTVTEQEEDFNYNYYSGKPVTAEQAAALRRLLGIDVEVAEARRQVLEAAMEAVTKDRNLDYGNPENNFQTIAEFWNVYTLNACQFTATDVAVMMDLVKTSRIMTSPRKMDHWVDKAGYSACGYRCAIADEDTGH